MIGAALGLLVPGLTWNGELGGLFVGALKTVAPILAFVQVASSLADSMGGSIKKSAQPSCRFFQLRFSAAGISNEIAMQLVGMGFIIHMIWDFLETAFNFSGDVLCTATAEFRLEKAGQKAAPINDDDELLC